MTQLGSDMRAVPASLNPAVVVQIDERLAQVEANHGVRIAWAIESGSRAWGFPSPDSDYDCRFIYVRPASDYLSLWPPRDVIETPLDKVFDVNGWDLAKTITLLVKGNATAIEWLRSPIVYTGDAAFRDGLLSLATEVADRAHIGRHYLHVARQQQAGVATLKRFFYVLRTATALRWLHVHPNDSVPPMDLPTLLVEAEVDEGTRKAATELIGVKARTREMGTGAPPAILSAFVETELQRADHFETARPSRSERQARESADKYFQSLIASTVC